jgi:hypothetical protein
MWDIEVTRSLGGRCAGVDAAGEGLTDDIVDGEGRDCYRAVDAFREQGRGAEDVVGPEASRGANRAVIMVHPVVVVVKPLHDLGGNEQHEKKQGDEAFQRESPIKMMLA